MSIGYARNHTNLYEIDVNYGKGAPEWARLARGISSVKWSPNETVSEDTYYSSGGGTEPEVTGLKVTGAFEGHRCYGDKAQDYIASKMLDISDRKTQMRWTQPNGDQVIGPATLTNIVVQGGDPNGKGTFSCDIPFNGVPVYKQGNSSDYPSAVTISGGPIEVAVGATASVNASVAPSTAVQYLVYGSSDDTIATVDDDGTIHGIKPGKVMVSAASLVKPSVFADVEVTVKAAETQPQSKVASATK